ncbi:Tn3 family transposase [Pigmentibacter sp. JX0631]|uniref:Tn3 family transposase n=1 Tax=Pigmentibacter sp. JX0631 TaxID=2976982 RepID=UPI0024693143|nr:Tn3 family transposase [Pigmentibacter sp. JX0631]WGL59759.1 Tn3 family transposase [Pigmentibacter sp. JX0631]
MPPKKSNYDFDEIYKLLPHEKVLMERAREKTTVPLAILIVYYRINKTFPDELADVPKFLIKCLAEQFELDWKDCQKIFKNYDLHSRTATRHRMLIRDFFGFSESTEKNLEQFKEYLFHEKLHLECRINVLKEIADNWFIQNKLEIPAQSSVDRVIKSVLQIWENKLFSNIFTSISTSTKNEIDALLQAPTEKIIQVKRAGVVKEKKAKSGFALVKDDPGKIGLDSLMQEVKKFDLLSKISCTDISLNHLSLRVLKKYKNRVSIETIYDMRTHPETIRYPLMSIYAFVRKQEITDTIADLLIQLIHKISSNSEGKVEKELLEEIKKKVSGKNEILLNMSESSVENPKGTIEEIIFPVASEETLRAIIKELKQKGTSYHEKVHYTMRDSYSGHYRKMLPEILQRIEFRSNNYYHKPIIEGLNLLKSHLNEKNRFFNLEEENQIDSILKKSLRNYIIEEDKDGSEKINRISFEICLLQSLREGLRCREVWIVGANRYRNPDEDLPDDFDTMKKEYYEALNLPIDAKEFIKSIIVIMEKELRALNHKMSRNKKVKILDKGKGWIHLTPIDEQEEPENLKRIQKEIFKRWKHTSLLDVLKETDLRVGFTNKFSTVGTQQFLEKDILQRRLLSCLFSIGTNTGLTRVSSLIPGEHYHELSHVKKTYITKEQLRDAIATVVNATFQIRKKKIWGNTTVTCASDSKKFGAWEQNLMTEHHIRYNGRGIMIYWHVEKKSMCIYSQVKSCSSSEVSSMIEGVLRHCTDMKIEKHFVDSHGQSEIAFAFTHLLGFQLMPRLKRIHAQKLYLPHKNMKEELKNLSPILTKEIDCEIIEQQYDQMVKYATALRLGTAETESILKRFSKNPIKHPTYQALHELGKIIKTIFLCRYLDSEDLRQEIHEGLNVVERWNGINGFIFYGKNSEFASNRLEDHELSVLALHLLQVCLVYVNTLMIQEVLSEKHWFDLMEKNDFRALTPLIHSHINPYGKFTLDMKIRIPLKDILSA